jgi:sterol desaturase/sphingolipid hydroxylase (fatty acid hydroxylase superfamily)
MFSIGYQMGWLAFLGVIEWVASEWPRAVKNQRRRLRNLCFLVANHATIPALSLLLVHGLAPVRPSDWVGSLPAYLGLPLAIVVFDFAGYWFHRFSHRMPLLWRFHQIHHLDEDFDFTTGARVHTLESILHQGVLVALATLLGIPASYLAVFSTVAFTFAILHHANITVPRSIETWLRLVIITPALHVPHHHDQIQDTDTNFGFIFPWWDRMFGTYNTRQRTSDWRIGLDYSDDLGLARLAIQPFIPTPLKDSAELPDRYRAGNAASTIVTRQKQRPEQMSVAG